jgi:uncharacterized membrane protein
MKLIKNDARRVLAFCLICIAVNTLIFILVWQALPTADDVGIYFRYARRMLNGELPYRDFLVEYPPVSLPFFLMPALAAQLFGNLSLGFYQPLFYVQNGLVTSVTLWLVYKLLLKLQPDLTFRALIWRLGSYVLGAILISLYLFQRYDIGATLFTFGAIYLFLHNRPGWAGSVLALATACKLFPAIILPLFLIYYWHNDLSRVRTIARHIAAFAITGLVTTLPFFLLSPSGFLKFLSYHGDRGIEVETIFASVIVFAHYLDFVPALVMIEAASVGLASPWSRPLATLSTLLTLAGLAALYVYFWRIQLRTTSHEPRAKTLSSSSIIIYQSSIVILWFIIANKVISPQYMVWLLPFVPFWKSGWARALYLLALPLSFLPFPFLIDWLFRLDPLPYVLLVVRNGLLVAIFVLLLNSLRPRLA